MSVLDAHDRWRSRIQSHIRQSKNGGVMNSYRSLNYPERYIRHRSFLAYIDPIVASDHLGRNDATFRLVPGLAGRCSSFESVNYPGFFLRHQDFRLKLAKQTDDQLFKEDATFCIVP